MTEINNYNIEKNENDRILNIYNKLLNININIILNNSSECHVYSTSYSLYIKRHPLSDSPQKRVHMLCNCISKITVNDIILDDVMKFEYLMEVSNSHIFNHILDFIINTSKLD